MSLTVNTEKRVGPEGKLYDLLMQGLPDFRTKINDQVRLNINEVAGALGVSHEAIYKMMRPGAKHFNIISVKMARRFTELSGRQKFQPADFRKLSLMDFEPFLSPE